MKFKGTQIYIEKETVFRLLDCRKENPFYGEMELSYETLLEDMKKLCLPEGILDFANASELQLEKEYPKDTVFAMVLYTIGEEISERITQLFEKNEYFDGMVLDAMADSCLFSMEQEWRTILSEQCKKRNLGIEKRMEAPLDFPVEVQKRIWQLLDGESIGVTMTSAYMFSPVKTLCLLFMLTDDVCQNNAAHDCQRCSNLSCCLRRKKK